MNWINEIKTEINSIHLNKKNLRNFGLLVGGVFLVISFWLIIENVQGIISYLLVIIGGVLFISGIFIPNSLKIFYKIWMGFAIVMGWFTSRILLTILFFLVITPIGLIARLFNKRFLDINFKEKKESYWINKPEGSKIDYKKMF